MKKEEKNRFCFIQSPFGVISGVAFREGGGIVASFKLEVKEDNIHSEAEPQHTMTIKTVFKPSGKEAYDILNQTVSKYSEYEEYTIVQEGYIFSSFRTSRRKAMKALEQVKKVLGKSLLNRKMEKTYFDHRSVW